MVHRGINNEAARDLNIGMSFLDRDKKYTASIYTDDPEVASRTRVKIDRVKVDNKTVYVARLGKNKGIAFHLKPN
jgi:alpha-glucosidase